MKSSPEVETLKRAVNAQVSSKSNNETASVRKKCLFTFIIFLKIRQI